MSNPIVRSIEAEFLRYKSLAEAASSQVDHETLFRRASPSDNSIATIIAHIGGNLHSRFTDFLTADGEKSWRDRESEFNADDRTRGQLDTAWEDGWAALLAALAGLTDPDLERTVHIRAEPLAVHHALHRSLAHTAYHVGQIVYLCKMARARDWSYLSIPPGDSERFNEQMGFDPRDRAARTDASGTAAD